MAFILYGYYYGFRAIILRTFGVQVEIMAQMTIFGSTQPVQLALLTSKAATCWCLRERWGVSQHWGYRFGGPRNNSISGSILGSPSFWETTKWVVDSSSNPLGKIYPHNGTYIHSPTPPYCRAPAVWKPKTEDWQ